MKKKVSENQLILIVAIAIVISSFSMILSFTKLNLTGGASIEEGYVNVTVTSEVAMTLLVDSIEFIATKPGVSRNSYNSSEVKNCGFIPFTWFQSCGLIIVNDGSCFINITIQELEHLFDSSSFDDDKHYTYNVTMNDPLYTTAYGDYGDCSVGYAHGLPGVGGVGYWRAIPRVRDNSEVAVCYLNFTDTPACPVVDGVPAGTCYRPDVAMIEINITVPIDEPHSVKQGSLQLVGTAIHE